MPDADNGKKYPAAEETNTHTMTEDTITRRQVEELSSELWSISNEAGDLECDIITSEITPTDAAEKFDDIISELRKLVDLYTP